MKIYSYTGGPVETNGYLLKSQNHYLLIDAPEGAFSFFSKKYPISELFLTHQHYDHIQDAFLFQDTAKISAFSNYEAKLALSSSVTSFKVNRTLKDNEEVLFGNLKIQIFHVPGHSQDSLVFYFPDEQVIFSGDTLFANSIGRTDLLGGNHKTLITKIRNILFQLPKETIVFPGHGPKTVIGEEIFGNPFFL